MMEGKIQERRMRGSIFGRFAYKADLLPTELPRLVFGLQNVWARGGDRRYPYKFRYRVEE